MHYIIFTDLDGTLLDHYTYSYAEAQPTLDYIYNAQIPLILVSSKTRSELIYFRQQLRLEAYPFVVENGAAVFSPVSLFEISAQHEIQDNLSCYRLGKSFSDLKDILDKISQNTDYKIHGFHNAGAEEISRRTGLQGSALRNAMNREFSIPLFYDEKAEKILLNEAHKYDLQLLYGGRFMHLVSMVDKGDALKLIMEGYRIKMKTGDITSIACGDSQNDFAMLRAADIAVLVKRFDGTYESRAERPDVLLSPEIGPRGWNISILKILQSGGKNE